MQIIPKQKFLFPTHLLDFLIERKVTTLIWAVSALNIIPIFKGFEYKVPLSIKHVLFSGEFMPIKHLNAWKTYVPNAKYVNLYGPTEITCNCTYYKIEDGLVETDTLPIGIPFKNERVFLLNDQLELVTDINTQGEICVLGTALSLGYFNNKEETNKAFIQNPLNNAYNELIYKTGDLGYYKEDGLLYFSPRKDFQIKHMGHRIELTEIDASILTLELIKSVLSIYDKDKQQIISFYQGEVENSTIIKQLRSILPNYMIPNKMIKVNQMPLTVNGKINRKLLKEQFYNE